MNKNTKSTKSTRPDVHPHAKLNVAKVRTIRKAWKTNSHLTMAEFANKYKVSVPCVSHVIYGLTWRNV